MTTLIEEKGLEEAILRDFYIERKKIGEISRKYDIKWGSIAYFIEKHETENTELYLNIKKEENLVVYNQINILNQKLWSWLEKVEKLAEEQEKQDKLLVLRFIPTIRKLASSINDQLSQYINIAKVIHDVKEKDELRNAFIEVIKEENPEIAQKIINKLKEYKGQRNLLL